jgi:hypothetical protein
MIKATVEEKSIDVIKPMNKMDYGEIGVIIDHKVEQYNGSIVMRSPHSNKLCIIDLSNLTRKSCWSGSTAFIVRILPKGTKVILEVI